MWPAPPINRRLTECCIIWLNPTHWFRQTHIPVRPVLCTCHGDPRWLRCCGDVSVVTSLPYGMSLNRATGLSLHVSVASCVTIVSLYHSSYHGDNAQRRHCLLFISAGDLFVPFDSRAISCVQWNLSSRDTPTRGHPVITGRFLDVLSAPC